MATSKQVTSVRSAAALGRAIRAARAEREWTQSELAERSGMNRFALAQIESGKQTKALEQMFRALAALGLELNVQHRGGWR